MQQASFVAGGLFSALNGKNKNMIKCQQCRQFINTGPGEKCPKCGSTNRFIGEKVTETLGFADAANNIFERINRKILLFSVVLTLLSSLLSLFFSGIQGILISFFVGIIILIVVPYFREKRID